MLHEIEQIVVSPVQILEHEHQGSLLGQRLEEVAPSRERLFVAVAVGRGFAS
jgi:hypothetical protein